MRTLWSSVVAFVLVLASQSIGVLAQSAESIHVTGFGAVCRCKNGELRSIGFTNSGYPWRDSTVTTKNLNPVKIETPRLIGRVFSDQSSCFILEDTERRTLLMGNCLSLLFAEEKVLMYDYYEHEQLFWRTPPSPLWSSGRVKTVAFGGFNYPAYTVVYLTDNGEVYADGDNQYFQLGYDSLRYVVTTRAEGMVGVQKYNAGPAVRVPIPVPVVDIKTGAANAIALDADGNLWEWGCWINASWMKDYGTGDDDCFTPFQRSSPTGIARIYKGKIYNNFAIDSAGRLWVWGDNRSGSLGVGHTNPVPEPVLGPNIGPVVSIVINDLATYALTDDGTVWGWGSRFALGGIYTPTGANVNVFTDTVDAGHIYLTPKRFDFLPPIRDIQHVIEGYVVAVAYTGEAYLWQPWRQIRDFIIVDSTIKAGAPVYRLRDICAEPISSLVDGERAPKQSTTAIARDTYTIRTNDGAVQDARVILMDMTGREVTPDVEYGLGDVTLNLRALATGVYVMAVYQGATVQTTVLLVQR